MSRDPSLVIIQGTLDVLILKALSAAPQHGYGISAWIRERTDGELGIEDGALYQALHRLEHRGSIDAEWGLSDNNRRARYLPADARRPARAARRAGQLAPLRAGGLARARRARMRSRHDVPQAVPLQLTHPLPTSSATSATRSRSTSSCASASSIDAGATPDAARAEAHRQFGDVAATAAYCRRMDTRKETRVRMRLTASELRQDLTYARPDAGAPAGIDGSRGAHDCHRHRRDRARLRHRARRAARPASVPRRRPPGRRRGVSVPDYRDLRESVRRFEATGHLGQQSLQRWTTSRCWAASFRRPSSPRWAWRRSSGADRRKRTAMLPSRSSATGCGSADSVETRGWSAAPSG